MDGIGLPGQTAGQQIGAIPGSSATSARDYYGDDQFAYELNSAREDDWLIRGYSGGLSKGEVAKLMAERASAREARQWELALANTAFQRKVADMKAAGFSPLAALEASQGAAVPSAATVSGSGGGNSGGNIGSIIGAIIAGIAMIASKGLSSAASAAKVQASQNNLLAALVRNAK